MPSTKFPLEKILNMDIRDYAASYTSGLGQYKLKGIHTNKSKIDDFADLVPDGTKVVVNYKIQFFGAGCGASHTPKIEFRYFQSGIALIPK